MSHNSLPTWPRQHFFYFLNAHITKEAEEKRRNFNFVLFFVLFNAKTTTEVKKKTDWPIKNHLSREEKFSTVRFSAA